MHHLNLIRTTPYSWSMVLYFMEVRVKFRCDVVLSLMVNLACFRPMMQYAGVHNLRFVIVNQRDYPGSNPLSADELRDLESPDAQADVLRGLGRGLVAFVDAFVQGQGIVPIRMDGHKRIGGLTILNWSLGNLYTWSILGNAATYEKKTVTFLEQYLRTIVVFGEFFLTAWLQKVSQISDDRHPKCHPWY